MIVRALLHLPLCAVYSRLVNLLLLRYAVLQATVMMSLLQPPPEVFDLFDDVLLLRYGILTC